MKIKLELTIDETKLIMKGLEELPAKMSFSLLAKLMDEGNKQIDEWEKMRKDLEEKEMGNA